LTDIKEKRILFPNHDILKKELQTRRLDVGRTWKSPWSKRDWPRATTEWQRRSSPVLNTGEERPGWSIKRRCWGETLRSAFRLYHYYWSCQII